MEYFTTYLKLCSNSKENNMAERTKLWIADKMKELMKKKSIDKIRITEICQAAEIERSTFYYHFKDKYELVAWIFFQSADRTDIIDLHDAANAMKQMKNEMLFYKRVYEDTSQNALWQYMLEYFAAKYTELAKTLSGTEVLDTQLIFSIRLYCYGAVGMTKEWVLQDNLTSAETIVQMMFTSMPESLKQIYFKSE